MGNPIFNPDLAWLIAENLWAIRLHHGARAARRSRQVIAILTDPPSAEPRPLRCERPMCGAPCRRSKKACTVPCYWPKGAAEPATRCRYHGGLATGPRTVEGKARIGQAMRDRWAAYRRGEGPRPNASKPGATVAG